MSKYYKAEDVIRKRAENLADTSYWEYGNPKNVDEWIEVAEMEFKDLPTIEVSEDCDNCIWNTCNYNKVPWEVSEDCISRKWLKENAKVLGDYYENTVWAVPLSILEDAPSVVPKLDSRSKESE